MKLLYSAPFSAGMLNFFLPNGKYGGFLLAYRGTNNVTPKTRADIGNVNLTWDGSPLINVDFELLSYLNDMKGGFNTFTSTASSTLSTACYLPCGGFTDKNNIYFINDTSKVYFKLDFPNLAGITGNVYIYGIPKEGIMNYQQCYTQRNVVAGGAGLVSDVHTLNNVSNIYLLNHSIIDTIQIQRDNQTLIDGLKTDIQTMSDFFNEVEVSNTLIELDINRSSDFREIISSQIQFRYNFTSAGNLKQYFAHKILTPQRSKVSLVSFENDLKIRVEKSGIAVTDGIKPVKLPASLLNVAD